MSVVDNEKVDGIAITPDKKGIKLFISDHLDWKNEYKHLLVLQEKINAYILFFESGQYKDIYKDIEFAYGVFEIHFMYEPTEKAILFLHTVQKQVLQLGVTIEFLVSGSE